MVAPAKDCSRTTEFQGLLGRARRAAARPPPRGVRTGAGGLIYGLRMVGQGSISGVVPFLLATTAQNEGFEVGSLLADAGIEGTPRADEHVSIERYFEVWRRAMTLIGDPAFALRAAAAFALEDSEVFGFLAISCETLGGAYERTAAYRALYNIGARWELELEPNASRLIWHPWPGDLQDVGYRAAMDYAVADMSNSICRLGRTRPLPRAVALRHAAPERTGPFSSFYGVAPTFGADRYELEYEAGLPALPIESFNSRLRDYFDEECRVLVAKLGAADSIVEQVRKKLIGAMDGSEISIEKTAKHLGLSARSLQRRLADEGTGYNEVLTEVRAEFAKRYLARGTVSASEVAYLLGFTEPPAFFKAFKRWTGMTPRAFQQRAGPALLA